MHKGKSHKTCEIAQGLTRMLFKTELADVNH